VWNELGKPPDGGSTQPRNQINRMTITDAIVRFPRKLETARAAPEFVLVLKIRLKKMKPKLTSRR
jgi:hypothetical protein